MFVHGSTREKEPTPFQGKSVREVRRFLHALHNVFALSDESCQTWLYEALKRIANNGYQSQEWLDAITDEVMEATFNGAVG